MRLAVVLCLYVTLTGCITSVHPLYCPGEKTFDKKLLGDWYLTEADKDEAQQVRVAQTTVAGEAGYRITPLSKELAEKEEPVLARLARIDRVNYLDVQEVKDGVPGPHFFTRLKEMPDGYDVYMFNDKWVKGHLEGYPKAVKHRTDGNTIELTAKQHGLHRFIRSINGYSDAWELVCHLRRTALPPKPKS